MNPTGWMTIAVTLFTSNLNAQNAVMDSLPYRTVPEAPAAYSPETVAARMIDGLGFRYYWATEGLREEDLAFRPSPEARTSGETIDHVLALSQTIRQTIEQEPGIRDPNSTPKTFLEKRKQTLLNLAKASELLQNSGKELEDLPIVFIRGDQRNEFPFWNLINGQIADAIWHAGQIVSFRRSSGNPVNPKVNFFTGAVRE